MPESTETFTATFNATLSFLNEKNGIEHGLTWSLLFWA